MARQVVKGLSFLTGADIEMNKPDADGNVGYIRPSSQPPAAEAEEAPAAEEEEVTGDPAEDPDDDE